MLPGNVEEAGLEGGEWAEEEGGARWVAIARMGLSGGLVGSAEDASKVRGDNGAPGVVSGKED